MNTHPDAKRVLCFGDSNTWGRSGKSIQRYPIEVRWTGILQNILGDGYEVIEEGLRGRTTNLDTNDPNYPGKNGREYLVACLEAHAPLDVVILWLGTNDMNVYYKRSVHEIAEAISELTRYTKSFLHSEANENNGRFLLLSPPFILEKYLKPDTIFSGAELKSKKLGPILKQVAKEEMVDFLDMAKYVFPGEHDGVHLEPEEHTKVAELLAKKVKILLNT